MTLSRRELAGFAAAALLVAACTKLSPPAPEQTIYLVRHAEKQTGDDPSLTPGGHTRAIVLAETLGDAGITHIYSTDYARTRETAAPIAGALGLSVETYDPADLPAFASQLQASGETTLVVGHSNTTPGLVESLGGDPGSEINEAAEYDRLYVLHIRGDQVETELRRYGTPYQP